MGTPVFSGNGEEDVRKNINSRNEQEVKLYMEDHELASSEKYRVSWANVQSLRLDTKRIRQELPDVYQRYAKESSSRRFQIKAA